jgi:NAD(P)-dependent dehydrogenase (short-subunit alcohol dehydrogenase family)
MKRLQDRVAIVTGAGGGIGLASARRLALEGAHVVCVDIDTKTGQAAADEVDGLFIGADVSDENAVAATFSQAFAHFGRIDIAFNNAGISPADDRTILETPLAAWRRVQEVNLTSVYLCSKYAVKHMLKQQRGSIINTSSILARMGAATSQISYTASKGGILAMTRELGVQFARQGIRVNALCPGPVNTPLMRGAFDQDPDSGGEARRLAHIPMGRFGTPAEIAAAVAFLASDDSSYMTGAEFLVDGGISASYVTPSG